MGLSISRLCMHFFSLTRSLHIFIVVVSISLLLPNAHWTNTRTKLWCRPEMVRKKTACRNDGCCIYPVSLFLSFSELWLWARFFRVFYSLHSRRCLKSVHRGNFPVIISILMVIWYKLFFFRQSHDAYACYACAACFSSVFLLLLLSSIVVPFNSWAGVTGTRGRQSAQYAICIMHFKYYLLFIKNYEHEWITQAAFEKEKKAYTQSLNWLCHTQKPTMNIFRDENSPRCKWMPDNRVKKFEGKTNIIDAMQRERATIIQEARKQYEKDFILRRYGA